MSNGMENPLKKISNTAKEIVRDTRKLGTALAFTVAATVGLSKESHKTAPLETGNNKILIQPDQAQALQSSLDQVQREYESVIVEKNEVEKDFKTNAESYLTILDRKFQTLPKSEQKEFEALYGYPKAIKHAEQLRAERKNNPGVGGSELDKQINEADKLVDDLDALSSMFSGRYGLDTPININDFWSAGVNSGAENRNDVDTHIKFGHYPKLMRAEAPIATEKEIEANKKAEIITEAKTAMAKITKANQKFETAKLTEKEMTALNAIGLDTSQTLQEPEMVTEQKPQE